MTTEPRERSRISTLDSTRYEVVFDHAAGREVLGYTARTGRRGLEGMIPRDGHLATLVSDDDMRTPVTIKGGGVRCEIAFGAARLRFSGRTEREAAGERLR